MHKEPRISEPLDQFKQQYVLITRTLRSLFNHSSVW